MSDMFSSALSGDKNTKPFVKSGESPTNEGVKNAQNAQNTVNYTVNRPQTAPKTTRKVLADEATQNFLNTVFTPRQNRREETQPEAPEVETPKPQDRPINDADFDDTTDPNFEDPENDDLEDDTSHLIDEDEDIYQEDEDENGFVISDEVIDNFVTMGVDYIDLYVPRLLAWLNEVEDLDEFRAHKESIADIKKHAVKFARENKNIVIDLSPAQSLALAVGMAYLPGILSATVHRAPMLLKYIARGFKTAPKTESHVYNAEFTHVPSPKCMHPACNTLVHKGQGYPKTSKHKDLVGRFCSLTHFKSYCNIAGITGTNSGA